MNITHRPFGTTKNGHPVTCWTLASDAGCSVEILDYGCTIRGLTVPNAQGTVTDVILGHDTIAQYENGGDFQGATVGRVANRIAGGTFTLNGQEYHLAVNNGPNHLHGGPTGFQTRMWDVTEAEGGLKFSVTSPDGDEGYPGTMETSLTFTWKDGTTLMLQYAARSDKDTILNLTNHSYFNLSGHGTIEDQLLQVAADTYNESDENCLVTGRILPVEGTVMDFRTLRPIGTTDYDNNYILTCSRQAVRFVSRETGIVMTVSTDQPAVQLYSGNFVSNSPGKYGQIYDRHCGMCLETQHYPDSIHYPQWPSTVLKAGEEFRSYTAFSFGKEV